MIAQGRGEAVDYIKEKAGLYHLAGAGACSRFEWAKEILRLDPKAQEQIAKELLPAVTSDFPTPAKRPLLSALDNSYFQAEFDLITPDWKISMQQLIN